MRPLLKPPNESSEFKSLEQNTKIQILGTRKNDQGVSALMHKKLDPKEELQVNDYLEFQQPSKGQLTPMGGSLKSYEGQL